MSGAARRLGERLHHAEQQPRSVSERDQNRNITITILTTSKHSLVEAVAHSVPSVHVIICILERVGS